MQLKTIIERQVDVLFKLLRIALGNETVLSLPADVHWSEVMALSVRQGVVAIACDGLQRLFVEKDEILDDWDEEEKYEWLMHALNLEKEYLAYQNAVADLARFYQSIGITMMVLKGYGLSLNYPIPSHRPMGDIDIYLMGQQKRADRLMSERLGVKIDRTHHHHTVFHFEGQMVENHYDFVNIHAHLSNRRLERRLKQMAKDPSQAVMHTMPEGTAILLPPPTLNALFLCRHAGAHFAAEKMNLRQLLDWTLFVKAYHEKVDWPLFWQEAELLNMHHFVLCLNAIAVEELGFEFAWFNVPEELASYVADNRGMVMRVKNEILSPEYNAPDGRGSVRYVYSRFKRWRASLWKQQLVYSESMFVTFVVQVWSHLLKPSTLRN